MDPHLLNSTDSASNPKDSSPTSDPNNQTAAVNVIRSRIDALYSGQSSANTQTAVSTSDQTASTNEQTLQDVDPYQRTHDTHPHADQWKAYHSAWQTYYQKYYEAYYAHVESQKSSTAQGQHFTGYFSSAPEELVNTAAAGQDTGTLSKDQALFELRQKLLGKVRHQAVKVRKSRHFIPIAAALSVVAAFLFLQYNQVLFATVHAYVSPGAIDPQNIVIDPSSGTSVSQDPRLIIPKINVDVPALYDVGADHDSQMAAMEKGVAHFAIPGASSHPGQAGNTVLSGHSSNDLFDPGEYKFIFAQLEKLQTGDTLYANYQGTRYTYVVTKTEVVKPTEVSKLIYETSKPVMTLITCTPLGTSTNRLLVTAEQISPDPAASNPAPVNNADSTEAADIPGANPPTFLERLFGAN